MIDLKHEEAWAYLARHTRKQLVFERITSTEQTGDELRVSQNRWSRASIVLLAIGFVLFSVMIGKYWHNHSLFDASSWFFFGLFAAIAGLSERLEYGELIASRRQPHILIRYGHWPRVRSFEMPRAELRVRLEPNTGQIRTSSQRVLSLEWLGKTDRVYLSTDRGKSAIRPLFQALEGVLDHPAIDDSNMLVTIGRDQVIEVSRSPLPTSSRNVRVAKLVLHDENLAELKLTIAYYVAPVVFMVSGLVGVAIGIHQWHTENSPALVLFGGFFGSIGTYILVSRKDAPGVLVNRVQRVITVRNKTHAFNEVAALQMCSQWVISGGGDSYWSFQLNLVLCDPSADRVNIMCHGKESGFRADAAQLAAFMKKNLLDHTANRPNNALTTSPPSASSIE